MDYKVCVQLTMIFVLIKSSIFEEFVMKRELRKGDPLSSFLFFIVGESLNVFIRSVNFFTIYNVGTNFEYTIPPL